MATNIEIKRYSGGSWGTLYPKANWNNMDNKPSTFTPSSHTHNDYLEKTGGTITSTSGDAPLAIQSKSNASWLQFKNSSGVGIGFLGINASQHPCFFDTSEGEKRLALYSEIPDISGKVDKVVSLASNIDLNTIVNSGFYRINGGTTSHGFPGSEWSQMIVSKGEDTIAQIGFPYNSQYVYFRNGVISNNQISGDWTRLANASEIPSVPSWALAANKPSYTFSGSAVTSGANSGSAVAAVTGYANFSGGSGTLVGNTTSSDGIPYVEASLNGTELTLTVKYLHHSHTGASLGTASTSNCAPSGHTHSVTAAGSVS